MEHLDLTEKEVELKVLVSPFKTVDFVVKENSYNKRPFRRHPCFHSC